MGTLVICSRIAETKYSAFIAKMNTFHSKIVDFTNEYINNINNIYEKLSFVSFSSSSAVLQQGGMSFLVAGMASFMVGIVIASCTILILNAIKNKKKQTNII